MPTTDNTLQRATPESQGVESSAILEFVEAVEKQVHELHSFILLRHGKVLAEGWWSPYGREYPHQLFSLSKSFTSTAIGFAVSESILSLDDQVMAFFPDEAPAAVNEHLAVMQIRHLLTMSTGQAQDTWSNMVDQADGDWVRGFFEVPVVEPPGTHFVYNNGATHLLSAIIQKITGTKLVDYLESRLFEPLGIQNATWQESPQGITAGGIGLSLTTEDVARFGQLYLDKGLWQGKRLLPEAWITEATGMQIANEGIETDWRQGYGYQFWRGRHQTYRGDGVFGQWCIVMPEQDAVLAITSGIDLFDLQQPLNRVWDILLPAMQGDALPDDATTQDRLAKKLSGLSMPTVQGDAVSSIVQQVSGRTYLVDDNELKLEAITLDFTNSGCEVHIKTAAGEETIPCGYDSWQRGQTTLFNQALLFEHTPVAASGAWTAEDTFTLIFRLYETPFFHTVVCHFAADELMIEVQINVSLESTKPHLLMARSVELMV